MYELLSLLILGIALSMDTFSLSLSIGTTGLKDKDVIKIALFVGAMHFIMPLLGLFVGKGIINIIPLSMHTIAGIILILIAIMMIKDLITNEKIKFELKWYEIFIFAFSVSIDSFSVGIGLKAITSNFLLASTIFSFTSFIFTLIGLIIGKYTQKKLGKIATIIGVILLFIIALIELLS